MTPFLAVRVECAEMGDSLPCSATDWSKESWVSPFLDQHVTECAEVARRPLKGILS